MGRIMRLIHNFKNDAKVKSLYHQVPEDYREKWREVLRTLELLEKRCIHIVEGKGPDANG